MTLIELIVALAMSLIVMTIVFLSWNNISRHILVHKRKGELQTETQRLATALTNQIRKSPKILHWSANSITLLSGNGTDTVHYSYNGYELKRNGATISPSTPRSRITTFEFQKEFGADAMEVSDILLEFTFGMEDEFENSLEITHSIKIRDPGESYDNGISGWNF
jgi:type II secretory pathway pseudopilin PulG